MLALRPWILVGALTLASALPIRESRAQEAFFRRGDANCDGALDVSDGVFTLLSLFAAGDAPCCLDAADADDSGRLDLSDAVVVFAYLFAGGARPAAPFDTCGADPDADGLSCLSFPPCELALTDPVLTEWTVPWARSRPRDPYIAPDGSVWFCGQTDDYVARLDLSTDAFTRFDLPSGAGPHNLIVGNAGEVWYAGNAAAHIGRLDPPDPSIHRLAMPLAAARDPHTLVFDRRGNIWFTVQQGNFVGRLELETEEIDLIAVPTSNARPYGIVVDADDRPWIVEFGTYRLGTIDPDTLAYREIALPRTSARPRRLVLTSDGAIWYVDYSQGYLGRFDPESETFREWRAPGGVGARPYGMAVDHRDRIWFVETGRQPNRFVGFDPRSETFFSDQPIPSGGGVVRHMHFDRPTQSVWFGTDANTIGRALVD